MKIDREAEALAREALAGVIGREPDRTQAAFEAIGEQHTHTVNTITFAVLREALLRVYRGVPSERQNEELAAEIASSESWTDVKPAEINTLLEAVSAGHPLALPGDRVAVTLFTTTAYLLASYVTQLGHKSWYDFLDQILNDLAKQQ